MLKKLIAPVVVSGALIGSLAIGGAAYAGTPASTTSASAPAATHHKARAWLEANRNSLRKAVVTIGATTIGITPQALVAELRSGKSMAQVAVAHGHAAQDVVDAMTTAADAKVVHAVTAGILTQPQADKIDAALPARLAKLVNHVF